MTTIASKNPAQPEQKRQYQTPREFEDILSNEAEQQLSDAQQRQRHERFLEALRKAYNGDLNEGLADNTNAVQLLSKNYTIEKGWEGKDNGEPIAFKNKTTGNTVFVSKDEIKHHDANGKFEYEDAVEMVRFAMLDVDMQRDGFFIRDASPEQQALIEAAVAAENAKLPAEYQIKVRNALDPKKNARALRKANRAAGKHKETIEKLTTANGFFAAAAAPNNANTAQEPTPVDGGGDGMQLENGDANAATPEPDPAHVEEVVADAPEEDLPEDVADQLEADIADAIAEDPDLKGGADVADPAADQAEALPLILTKDTEQRAKIVDAATTFRNQPFFQRNVPEADRQTPVTDDQLIAIFEGNGGVEVPEEPKARGAFLSAVKDNLRESGHLVRKGLVRKQDYLGNPRNPSA